MTDLLILIFSGALVGFAIGLTGVGGGSLMTPILLLLGYPAPVAIGTDLLYAAVTKTSGVFFHHRKQNVNWKAMATARCRQYSGLGGIDPAGEKIWSCRKREL